MLSVILFAVLLITVRTSFSQTQQKLVGADTEAGDYFGSSVSVDSNVLLVGAFYADEPYNNSGAAFIFEESGGSWSQQAKLISSTPAADDAMGFDVSLSGNIAVVGAPWDDLSTASGTEYNTGSAVVFVKTGSTWIEQQKIMASDALALSNFGWGVSTDGTYIVVGAPRMDTSTLADSGAVYIYKYVNGSWAEEAKLTAPNATAVDEFGRSVFVSGNTLIVGAWQSDIAATDAGAVFIYQKSAGSWSLQQTLTATDAVIGDGFGEYVSRDNDLLLIGSWLSDDNGGASGSAYVFRLTGSTWIQEAKLVASDGATGDRLGFRLDIQNGIAAVGSRADDHSGLFDAGSTYLFEQVNGSWQQIAKIIATDAQAEDNMGIGVAISNDVTVSSAERHDHYGVDAGSVYVDDIPVAQPTSTPVPLAAAMQKAPIDSHNNGMLTYEWLEVENATDYTLVVYDVDADTVVFSNTFASSICTSNNCLVQPQNLSLSASNYTWLVRGFNNAVSGLWSVYNSSACNGLVKEAEDGNLNNYFVSVNNGMASGGQYVHVPEGTGNEWYGPISGKQADYCFKVSTPGTYNIKGWVQGTDVESDAFFVKVDGNPNDGYLWDIPISGSIVEDYVSDRGVADPVNIVLSAGVHHISVYVREDGARLDKLELEFVSTSMLQAASAKSSTGNTISGVVNSAAQYEEATAEKISLQLVDMFSYGLDFKEITLVDANGRYLFESVPHGHYNLRLMLPDGYESIGPSSVDIEIREEADVQIPFDIKGVYSGPHITNTEKVVVVNQLQD